MKEQISNKEQYPFGTMFEVELKGVTPLMHHRMTDEQVSALLGAKKGKKKSPKQELTPREIATKHAYEDESGNYCIPMSYVCGAFRDVSSDYKQKDSSRKSYKAIAGGIFRPLDEFATLLDKKGKPIKKFEVDVRKATNHLKGAVAVCRPRFDQWNLKFRVMVDDTIIDPDVANQILCDAGRRSGIGSFRVNKSGYYGQFIVERWKQVGGSKVKTTTVKAKAK